MRFLSALPFLHHIGTWSHGSKVLRLVPYKVHAVHTSSLHAPNAKRLPRALSVLAERSGPGALTHLTNSMFLQTLAGAKTLMGAAAWATCTLLGSQKDNRFPLAVRVHTGERVMLSVVRPTLLSRWRLLDCLAVTRFTCRRDLSHSDRATLDCSLTPDMAH